MAQSRPLDINILPDRYRPRQVAAPVASVALVVAALLFGLMPAYALLAVERGKTADLESRLDRVQEDLDRLQVNQVQLEQVEEQIEQARDQITQLHAELEAVGQQAPSRSQGVWAISNAMSPGVNVTAVAQTGDLFTITGEAESQELVLDCARALQSSGWFVKARVLSIVTPEPATPAVRFSIEVEQ